MKLYSKKVLVGMLCLFFGGCTQKKAVPEDVIGASRMSQIIADMQLTEAKISRMNFGSYDSSKVAFGYLQQQVLAKYGIDSVEFRRNYEAYARYPTVMEEIYQEALTLLNAKADSLEKANHLPPDERPKP